MTTSPAPVVRAQAAVVAAAPVAPALSVTAGPVQGGTSVELSGTGVGTTMKVWFGTAGVTAVTKVSATRVRVVTPAHAAGVVNVRVTTPAGTSPVSIRSTFAFDPVPTVTSLSVGRVPTVGGTLLTVTGTDLTRSRAVYLGPTAATAFSRLNATQVRVTVPGRPAGAVAVRVLTPGGMSPVTSAGRLVYVAPPVVPTPTVSGLSTVAGPTRGGTVLTVTGTRLTGATKVTFGGVAGTQLTVLSSTQLRVTAPAHAAGAARVVVTTPGGSSAATTAGTYTYIAPPTLTRVWPASGGTGGGTVVIITGTGLSAVTSVWFGTTAAPSVTPVSSTSMRVVSPPHAPGTVDVRVTSLGGTTSPVSSGRFGYYPPPAVTSLSAAAGPLRGGTPVLITGTRLASAAKVTFGGTPTSFTVVSATTIRAVAPARPAGVVHVHVSSANGTSRASAGSAYAYEPVPTITGLTPQIGPPAGGTSVTLTGADLGRATSVTFGTTTTTGVVRVSPTTLRVITPPRPSGPVEVRVTAPGGTSLASAMARFTYGWPPVVSGLSVSAGPLKGGTVVTLSGVNLAEVREVRFGTALATGLVRISDSSLQVTAPPHAEGAVRVRATNVNGTSTDNARATFEYVGVPAVTALSVPAGPLTGGTVITVTGTRLALTSGVTFGGRPGTGLVRVSATTLRVTAPANAFGAVDVTVTTPGGVSPVVAAGRFEYLAVPTVSGVTPTLAGTKGGTVVTLTGSGYRRVSAVTFGGVPANGLTWVSASQLRVSIPAHAEADVDVRVTTPGGTSPVVPAGRFSYQDAPVISSVAPASGPLRGGNVVMLRGTSLTVVTGVWIGGVPATGVTRVSATQVTAVVPSTMATGAVPVRITTRAGTTTRAAAYTYVAGTTLLSGQILSSGTALRSPSGAYVATVQGDGNLVIRNAAGTALWSTGSAGAGSRIEIRADGNLTLVRPTGAVAWTSGTNGWIGGLVTLTDDGILQVRQAGTTVWDHRGVRYDRILAGQVLRSGESVRSTNLAWSMTMRSDGNLVLVSSAGIRRWASFTSAAGSTASMQSNGNLVIRNASGGAVWSTGTAGANSALRVLGTGNAAVYVASTVTWAVTGGSAPQNWTCYSRATQNCINRFGYYGQRAWNYPVDAWGNNCTNYSAYRLSLNGIRNPGNLGNAESWDNNARAKGFAVDQSPRVGDIAQWNSNHVAYVDWVSADGNQIAISESGYGGTVLGRTYTSMSGRRIIARTSSSWPSNFIHFR
ncbi:IPT/TIG domain-containing protein [Terrabacter koreensis]